VGWRVDDVNYSGKVGVLSVKEEARWGLEQVLTGGHSDIVRAMHMDVKVSQIPPPPKVLQATLLTGMHLLNRTRYM
jgi:hypothetical protein